MWNMKEMRVTVSRYIREKKETKEIQLNQLGEKGRKKQERPKACLPTRREIPKSRCLVHNGSLTRTTVPIYSRCAKRIPWIFLENHNLFYHTLNQGAYPQRLQVSQVALVVKNPPANAGDTRDRVWSLGQKDPLEEEMATHSSVLAWEIPWREEPNRLQVHGAAESWIRLSD